MNKYIDADKLIADIQFLIDSGYDNLQGNLYHILSLIESLQQEQPEVDLDREIIKYKVPFTDESEYLNETTLDAIARHFYELGLNARKV